MKTSENFYFSMSIAGVYFTDVLPTLEIQMDGGNKKIITISTPPDQYATILYHTGELDFSSHILNITLLNGEQLVDQIDASNKIINQAGLLISNFAVLTPTTLQQYETVVMGTPDSTGRKIVPPEEINPRVISVDGNRGIIFDLTNTLIRASCSITSNNKVTHLNNTNFKINKNSKFECQFNSPFTYWAYKNFVA